MAGWAGVAALLGHVVEAVVGTFTATWPFLLVSVLAATTLTVYVGTEPLSGWLRRRPRTAVLGAVGLATATPFCSCGTTAVTLGMIAATSPWAPIVAFLVASPLTSPAELVLSAGLLGWPFALLFFGGTIALGLAAGAITALLQRTGWLQDQARMAMPCAAAAGACGPEQPERGQVPALSMGPGAAAITEIGPRHVRWRLDVFARELLHIGRRMLVLFFGFTFLGYLVIEAVPTQWLQGWLGGTSLLSVVGAALLGIPMYLNTESSLPLLAGMMDGGMGPGPAMAFLVTGAGTSLGAMSGMLLIARRRIVALTIAVLLAGAVLLGLLAQVLLG